MRARSWSPNWLRPFSEPNLESVKLSGTRATPRIGLNYSNTTIGHFFTPPVRRRKPRIICAGSPWRNHRWKYCPMKLLTAELTCKLLRNGANRDQDHAPVVKFFNPIGSATWLISEMDVDHHDWLFGLCDLGVQCPELGTVSLHELESIRLKGGLKIERDFHFRAKHPMSYYADRARTMGYIDA
jgi:hypothetical protein